MLTPETDLHRHALVGRIAAGLAHDINGPIGVIIGFTDLAREAVRGNPTMDAASAIRLTEYLDMISNAATRARSLTRGVWTFAKTAPGTTGNVDVVRTIRMSAALATPELRGAKIESAATEDDLLQAEPGAKPLGPLVRADPALCAQAFVGLFLAAPGALPAGGSVSWNVMEIRGAVRIELSGRAHDGGPEQNWPVPEMARTAFEIQSGHIKTPGGPAVHAILPASSPAGEFQATRQAKASPR
ncbi:MAG: hypothetical protein HY678_12670 [Chloroflexi bacterium]|nr:hypothetical protein [Chloroflexota bacterium]